MIRQIVVDWDNFEALASLFGSVKARYFELKHIKHTGGLTRQDRIKQALDACRKILDCNISSAYSGCYTDQVHNVYYVYAHLDTRQPITLDGRDPIMVFAASLGLKYVPFYIGKGVGSRIEYKERSPMHGKTVDAIRASGKDFDVFKIREDMSELSALQLESKLIDIFGLMAFGGRLANIDEGYNRAGRQALYAESLRVVRKANNVNYRVSSLKTGEA